MKPRPISDKSGAAAAIAFGLGELLTLGLLFWGLNFVPDILAGPAVICFLALPFAASWAASWVAVRLLT